MRAVDDVMADIKQEINQLHTDEFDGIVIEEIGQFLEGVPTLEDILH